MVDSGNYRLSHSPPWGFTALNRPKNDLAKTVRERTWGLMADVGFEVTGVRPELQGQGSLRAGMDSN